MLSARRMLPGALLLIASVAIGQKKDSVWIKTATGCKIYNPYPQKDETVTWTGKCLDAFASSEGTLTWYVNGQAGSHYEGNMKRGVPSGQGRYYHTDGSVDEGIYERGHLTGRGTISKIEDARRRFYFEGEFKDGKRNGQGLEVLFKPNGDTSNFYVGSFIDNRRSGKARMIDFRDKGKTLIMEGICNNGTFLGNVRIWFMHEGKQVDYYEGSYGGYESPGVPSKGYGIQIDGHIKYLGEWANGYKNGKGKLYYDSALVYDGEFSAGDFFGLGTRYYFDGSKYKGDFKNGKRHGVGKLTLADGVTYTGEFKDDLFHGYGYFTTRDNKPLKCGLWEKGRLFRTQPFKDTIKSLQSRFSDKLKTLNMVAATATG
jgi:hypothetical protein